MPSDQPQLIGTCMDSMSQYLARKSSARLLGQDKWGYTALLKAAYGGHAMPRMLQNEFGSLLDEEEESCWKCSTKHCKVLYVHLYIKGKTEAILLEMHKQSKGDNEQNISAIFLPIHTIIFSRRLSPQCCGRCTLDRETIHWVSAVLMQAFYVKCVGPIPPTHTLTSCRQLPSASQLAHIPSSLKTGQQSCHLWSCPCSRLQCPSTSMQFCLPQSPTPYKPLLHPAG